MDGNSSHDSVNLPTTTTPTTNTRLDANTTSVNANKDMAWEWGAQTDPLKKTKYLVHLRVCGEITRLKEHLTHTGGNLLALRKKERKRTTKILRSTSCIDLSENDDEQDDTLQPQVKKRKFVSSSNVRGPIDDVYKSDRGKGKQTTLDKNNPIKEKFKNVAWKKITSVGLPFNSVYDEGFQDAINAIGEYGRGMPTASYHNMRVTLLKDVLEDTHKFVDLFRPQLKKFGCSIMFDFWKDGKQRSLINYLVNCPTGTVFLKSIDASEHIHNVEYIVKKVNEVIAEVGDENVVQFIIDNSSNYKAAGKILEEHHLKLFWTPCAAHCVNLIVQDIGKKEATIVTALTEARAIVVYIYNHGRILNMMRTLTKNREFHKSYLAKYMLHWWILFVWLTQKKDPQNEISKNLNDGNNDKKDWPVEFCLSFKQDAMTKFFIPYIQEYEANKQVMTRLYVAIDCLVPDEDENDTLRQELNLYIELNGEFGSPANKRSLTKVAPYIWWRSYGIDTPILRNFAITVLSQTCSASPFECNWSIFDTLHSKKINCLLQQKLNELENDDWTIPTEDELQDFVDGGDDLLWSGVQEEMGANVDTQPNIRSKRERYRDDDDDITDVGNDLDEEVNALNDIDSEVEPIPCD
uniref:DUF659 domain-containing protein n=1 Tax=Lactuca sativa TaxID=4236 RepID=A0A9R1XVG4_LACSA|nr:hypothetical protein LSAT_V11C100008550 [Lactuca sativa]